MQTRHTHTHTSVLCTQQTGDGWDSNHSTLEGELVWRGSLAAEVDPVSDNALVKRRALWVFLLDGFGQREASRDVQHVRGQEVHAKHHAHDEKQAARPEHGALGQGRTQHVNLQALCCGEVGTVGCEVVNERDRGTERQREREREREREGKRQRDRETDRQRDEF